MTGFSRKGNAPMASFEQCRQGESSMQRKGGEGERAHRGVEGRGGRERNGCLTPVVIKGMECEGYI